MDECKLFNCGYGQNCTNTPGSYVCSCSEGFRPDVKPGSCKGWLLEFMSSLLVVSSTACYLRNVTGMLPPWVKLTNTLSLRPGISHPWPARSAKSEVA